MKTRPSPPLGIPLAGVLAGLFVLPGSIAAQAGFAWPQLEVEGFRWPSPPPADAPFEVLAAGYVSDPFRVDADLLALRGAELVLHYQFVRFDALLPVASGVSGALVVPDADPKASKDALLVAGPAGLDVYRYGDADDGAFAVTSTELSGWENAQDLRFDGRAGLYAIASKGLQILRADWRDGVATPLDGIATSAVVLDLAPVDWDGDGDDEVLVLTTDAIQVLDPSAPGDELFRMERTSLEDRIAVSRGENGARDLGVLYGGLRGGGSFLVAANSQGLEVPFLFPGSEFDSLQAGSFDWLDGLVPFGDDLCLGDSKRAKVWLLRRTQSGGGSSFFFDTNFPSCFDLSRDGVTETQPIPVSFFDMDGDGDKDALFGLSGADVAVEAEHLGFDRHANIPFLSQGVFDTDSPSQWSWSFGILNLAPTAATHLQVEIWPEVELGAGRPEVGAGSWLFDLEGATGSLAFDASDLTQLSVLEIHVRPVQMDASGTRVLATFPEAVGFWSPDQATMETISLLPEVLPYGGFCPGCEGGDPLQGSGVILGGQGSNQSGMPPSQ